MTTSDQSGDARPAATARVARLSRLSKLWIWGFFPAFLLHDGEEAVVVIKDGGMRAYGRWETTAQGLAAILLVFTVALVAIVAATGPRATQLNVEVVVALIGAWTVHGVGHLALGAFSDGYTFGAVTALPGGVAYGLLALAQLRSDGVIPLRRMAVLTLAGLAAVAVILLAAHLFGRLVT